MTDYLTPPPAEAVIPATRGCDRRFSVQRVQAGSPTPFDAGTQVYIWIDIDKTAPTRVDAVVAGSVAAFTLPSTVLDLVRTGTRWRIVHDVGDAETALLVGRFERHDG